MAQFSLYWNVLAPHSKELRNSKFKHGLPGPYKGRFLKVFNFAQESPGVHGITGTPEILRARVQAAAGKPALPQSESDGSFGFPVHIKIRFTSYRSLLRVQ